MATDIRVVTPSDVGSTIVLGAKVVGKYDVDLSALGLAGALTGLSLAGTVLTATGLGGNTEIDLEPILPKIAADVFLKGVERTTDNKLKFTVGEKDSAANDTVFAIDVADLLPVATDGTTIGGNGTAADKLAVKIGTDAGNLLKQGTDGLAVLPADVQALIPATPARTIRLVNATGETEIGFIYATEQ